MPDESDANVARIWDAESGDVQFTLPMHSPVMEICFSPDGSLILSAHYDEVVRLWDAKRGELLATLDASGLKVCFSPDGKYIVVAEGRRTRLWNVGETSCIGVLTEHEDTVSSLAFSLDGSTLVSGDDSGTVYMRHLSDLLQH